MCYYLSMDKKSDSSLTREVLENYTREELVNVSVALFNRVTSLEEMLAMSKELRLLANAEKYSPSTEQMQFAFQEFEMICRFCDDFVALKNQKAAENEEEVKAEEDKVRKPRTPGLTAPADAPVVVVDHTEGAPEKVEKDGIVYERGEDKVIYKVAYTKRRKIVEKHLFVEWVPTVEVEDGEKAKIVGFEDVNLDALSCSASLIAQILVAKYDDHLPLYRQSEIFERNGDRISRQLMCHWIGKYYERLIAFDEYFGNEIFKMKMINQDETPLEVISLKSKSGKISSSSFAIIRVGSTFDTKTHKIKKVVHVYYSDGRSREKLFDGFKKNNYKGPLMTDGLKGYFNSGVVSEEFKCACWIHGTRPLKKYVRFVRNDASINKILYLHAQLYKIEDKLRAELNGGTITAEEFLAERRKEATPIIDKIFETVDITSEPYKKDLRQQGLNYLIEYKPYLYNYLNFVEATPDDNECERRAKAWATGRKNWLFCQNIDGADASCFFFSLIETAKENGLNPEDYLEYVLTYGPSTPKEKFDTLLPWNADMKRIEELHEAKATAKPDPTRTKPYIFTGYSR